MKKITDFIVSMVSEGGTVSSKRCLAVLFGLIVSFGVIWVLLHQQLVFDHYLFAGLLISIFLLTGVATVKDIIALKNGAASEQPQKDAAASEPAAPMPPAAPAIIGLILLSAFVFGGCGFAKHMPHHTMNVHDTVRVKDSMVVHDTVVQSKVLLVHDTVIGVSGHDIYAPTVHDTIIKDGPLRLVIRNHTVDCSSDSLTMVIANLVREKDSVYGNALVRQVNDSETVVRQELTTAKNTNRIWFGIKRMLIGFFLGLLVGVVMMFLFKLK